jgi:hypothetical protein
MRRLVLVLFAFALMCQGAVASVSPGCLVMPCCSDQAVAAPVHAACDAGAVPCDQDGCQCHAAALSALPVSVPGLPPAEKAPIVSGRYLHPAPQHVPDGPQRPPCAGAR